MLSNSLLQSSATQSRIWKFQHWSSKPENLGISYMLELSQGSTEIMFIFFHISLDLGEMQLKYFDLWVGIYKMLKHVIITVTTATMIATKTAK